MIITNSEQLAEALAWLEKQEIVAYDTETTGLNPRKDRIIGFGISSDNRGWYCPIFRYNSSEGTLVDYGPGRESVDKLLQALQTKKLLMFNASFDARFTKYNFGIDLVPALYADVLLLKHTVDEDFPFGLKEIASNLYGTDAKKEKEEMQASIKANGGSAKEYFKASLDTLSKYCIQDCILTYKLFTRYSAELRQQGLEKFYYTDEVLPLYKEVTISMEEQGIRLDLPLLQNSLEEIKVDLAKVEKSIQEAIAPHLELFTAWFLNKDYPLQTYTGKSPMWLKLYKTQYEAWQGENPGTYMFNLLSKHHLKKLFFDTLKETPLSRTPKGNPQVDEEFLELMGQKYEWAKQLIVYNKLIKLKGTYIERFLEEHEDGIFYPSFQQHRTVSGRYSGDLQQLPRPLSGDDLVSSYTNRIRSFFISSDSSVLMSADYEQLEPRTFCHVSKDPALAAIFNTGKDFYSEIARMVEGVTEVSKELRQKAKGYALGIPYGETGYKLQFELGITNDEGDELVWQYMNRFPSLANKIKDIELSCKHNGYVVSEFGRIRRLPQVKRIYEKYGSVIENDLELWKKFNDLPGLYDQAKLDRKVFKNGINSAKNYVLGQSPGASIMNRASIAIARQIKARGLSSRIVAQVHDELVLHVPVSEQQQVSALVKDAMENTTLLSVPLRTTPQCATNYRDCK